MWSASHDERARLSRQCLTMLDRLEQGPCTNRELSAISLTYTRRISDLREAGFDVQVATRDRRSGLTTYVLKRPIGATEQFAMGF